MLHGRTRSVGVTGVGFTERHDCSPWTGSIGCDRGIGVDAARCVHTLAGVGRRLQRTDDRPARVGRPLGGGRLRRLPGGDDAVVVGAPVGGGVSLRAGGCFPSFGGALVAPCGFRRGSVGGHHAPASSAPVQHRNLARVPVPGRRSGCHRAERNTGDHGDPHDHRPVVRGVGRRDRGSRSTTRATVGSHRWIGSRPTSNDCSAGPEPATSTAVLRRKIEDSGRFGSPRVGEPARDPDRDHPAGQRPPDTRAAVRRVRRDDLRRSGRLRLAGPAGCARGGRLRVPRRPAVLGTRPGTSRTFWRRPTGGCTTSPTKPSRIRPN